MSQPEKIDAVHIGTGDSYVVKGVVTFRDPITGVWYYATGAGGMSPRYLPDGSLYAGEEG